MKNPMQNASAYYPADFRRMETLAKREYNLCDVGIYHYVKIHNSTASLIISGISRIDGQAKKIYITL